MNLLVLALLKKASDQQSRHHSSSSKISSTEKHYRSSSSSRHTLEETLAAGENNFMARQRLTNCVYSMIKSNPEIMEAVDAYIETLHGKIQDRVGEFNAELETYCEPSADISSRYDKAISELWSLPLPVKLERSDLESEEFWYVRPNPAGPHASYHTAPAHLIVGGIRLDRATFESGKNPFREELERHIARNPKYREEYESLMAEVAALEKKKVTLFLRSSKRDELTELRTKLDKLKTFCDIAVRYQEYADKYDKIVTDEKEKLERFFDVQDEFRALSDKVYGTREKSLQITGYGQPLKVQDEIERSRSEAYGALTESQRKTIESIPSTISAELLALDDDSFEKHSRQYYHYDKNYYFASTDTFHDLITTTEALVREQYSMQKAKGSNNQPT